eukprot:NODE_748_length_772_cov_319.545455_g740_i0.p1 GENE.NODE_748_length_772_cov_319.545455_g740_i0~~NODE_748_length_772_cov_319.545455_g740_i0.p1  ORF type:complete len:163 (+),score=1.08 NODE_748_length_772_cov_319.545455_g740_i0:153-641(+)
MNCIHRGGIDLWKACQSGSTVTLERMLSQSSVSTPSQPDAPKEAGPHFRVPVVCDVNAREDQTNYTPLWYAAQSGHCRCAARLLRAGADVSLTMPGGATALHIAVSRGHADVITLLASHDKQLDTTLKRLATHEEWLGELSVWEIADIRKDGAVMAALQMLS